MEQRAPTGWPAMGTRRTSHRRGGFAELVVVMGPRLLQ